MSEVARLMRQIELECTAMQLALHGYATVASHKIITHRYDALARHHTALEKQIGKEEADRLVYEMYKRVVG